MPADTSSLLPAAAATAGGSLPAVAAGAAAWTAAGPATSGALASLTVEASLT